MALQKDSIPNIKPGYYIYEEPETPVTLVKIIGPHSLSDDCDLDFKVRVYYSHTEPKGHRDIWCFAHPTTFKFLTPLKKSQFDCLRHILIQSN